MDQSGDRMRQRILQQEIKRLGLLLRQEEAAHLASKGSFQIEKMLACYCEHRISRRQ